MDIEKLNTLKKNLDDPNEYTRWAALNDLMQYPATLELYQAIRKRADSDLPWLRKVACATLWHLYPEERPFIANLYISLIEPNIQRDLRDSVSTLIQQIPSAPIPGVVRMLFKIRPERIKFIHESGGATAYYEKLLMLYLLGLDCVMDIGPRSDAGSRIYSFDLASKRKQFIAAWGGPKGVLLPLIELGLDSDWKLEPAIIDVVQDLKIESEYKSLVTDIAGDRQKLTSLMKNLPIG